MDEVVSGTRAGLSTLCALSYPRWMAEPLNTLGIIAGNRSLPLVVAREARTQGVKKIVAVAFESETDPALAELVDVIAWLKVGQLGKLIGFFKEHGVSRCVMAGQIAPKNLFTARPDLRAMMMLVKLKEKNAHTVFGGIADELQRDGIELIEATPWLHALMAPPGFHLGPKLNAEQKADVEFGFRMAKEISRLEIGQLVVVKDGTVLAVEGLGGTDECLARGGQLAGKSGGAVGVKVAKEKHDMRFDIPCIGASTIETCAASGVAVLGLEAGKTLVLDMEDITELARRQKISVVAVS